MILLSLTDGQISGTGTIAVASGIIGAVLITADDTNLATVVIRRNNSEGKRILDTQTKSPGLLTGPFSLDGTQAAYFSITGTGASAQLYEWVE